MRTFETDYRYLLQNLIPFNRLQPFRRRSIGRVLKAGSRSDIRREAVYALEELARRSFWRREEPRHEKDGVVLTYARNDGTRFIRLFIPGAEWPDLERSLAARSPKEERREERSPAAAPPVSLSGFPELLRSFAVDLKNGALPNRLILLCSHLEKLFGLRRVSFRVLEGKLVGAPAEDDHLSVLHPGRAENDPDIRELEKFGGEPRPVVRKTAQGLEPGAARTISAVCAVHVLGDFWGVVEIAAEGGTDPGKLETMARTASGVIAQVIENSIRLEELVSVDKLTGIFNRRFYDMQLPIEVERATRAGSKLSMILLDIDDFKQINDELGHKKGDEALVVVAGVIKKHLRKIDLPFRYGGEEFVILLPGTAHHEAIHTAERLRSKLSEYRGFKDEAGNPRRITASFGIAVFPDHASNGEELFILADRAMFRAKKLGKNRIEIFRQ